MVVFSLVAPCINIHGSVLPSGTLFDDVPSGTLFDDVPREKPRKAPNRIAAPDLIGVADNPL